VVSRPGGWEKYFRADNPEGLSRKELAGPAIRPPPEWRTGDGRIAVLDQQGVHAALVFPTLASVIEQRLGGDKADTVNALFHSLNMWVDEEWGFARQERVFSVPFISLTDVGQAVAELDFVLSKGARTVAIRPAPVPHIAGSRSFGYPEYDPFWARVAEAGVFVCLHGSDTGSASSTGTPMCGWPRSRTAPPGSSRCCTAWAAPTGPQASGRSRRIRATPSTGTSSWRRSTRTT
jgi:hypothetical protein